MITLRRAGENDCVTIFEWRNDPRVRSHFFNSQEISYEEHKRWFQDSLGKESRIILIASEDEQPVGVLRFDITDESNTAAEIDIYVVPERHGMGLGRQILQEGERWIKRNTGIRALGAKVKEDNEASLRMFRACSFEVNFIHLSKKV